MSNTLGTAVRVTIFGESHGPAIGAVIDGLPPGLKVDTGYIEAELSKRSARGSISTARKEPDAPEFLSGVKDGFTEGTPLTIVIRNTNVKSSDYSLMSHVARPSHADYTAQAKYLGFQDAAGGGHFSGRLTAPLVAAGAILKQALEEKGILIGTHIARLGSAEDRGFGADLAEDIKKLDEEYFPVLDEGAAKLMEQEINSAASEQDSVGGVLETAITGLEAGLGEPMFGTFEGELAKALFAIPAVKGVEFGAGFALGSMRASQANDPFAVENGRIVTTSNNSGGINGGITNGMPVIFRTAVKPTASISRPQKTADFIEMKDTEIKIEGRHDPAIVHRARAVVDAAAAIVTADFIARRWGYMVLRNKP